MQFARVDVHEEFLKNKISIKFNIYFNFLDNFNEQRESTAQIYR